MGSFVISYSIQNLLLDFFISLLLCVKMRFRLSILSFRILLLPFHFILPPYLSLIFDFLFDPSLLFVLQSLLQLLPVGFFLYLASNPVHSFLFLPLFLEGLLLPLGVGHFICWEVMLDDDVVTLLDLQELLRVLQFTVRVVQLC